MRLTLHGRCTRPAVMIIGTWDPFLPAHARLIRKLVRYARRTRREAVAVVLSPHPSLLLHSRREWPVYSHVDATVRILQAMGVASVVRLRLARRELDVGARELFRAVTRRVRIQEVWLGHRQSLGPGRLGGADAIAVAARRHRFSCIRLPRESDAGHGSTARYLLGQGRAAAAARLVGLPPLLKRPRSRSLLVAWAPGRYVMRAVTAPEDAARLGATYRLLVTADRQGGRLVWPTNGPRWLAAVKGPAERNGARRPD
jgi:FAD synthase